MILFLKKDYKGSNENFRVVLVRGIDWIWSMEVYRFGLNSLKLVSNCFSKRSNTKLNKSHSSWEEILLSKKYLLGKYTQTIFIPYFPKRSLPFY